MLAPTGTISFMMDCDTTGIEPDIALVKYKQLAGGGMLKIVNNTVPLALKKLGLRRAADQGDLQVHRRARHDRRRPGPEGRAPAGLRLCLQAGQRRPQHRLAGPRADDGRRPAVPLRRDQQDGQHADRRRRRRTSPTPTSGAGSSASRPWPSIATARSRASRSTPSQRRRTRKRRRRPATPRRAASGCPTRGNSITHKFNVGGHEGYINVGLYPKTAAPASCSSRWPRKARTVGGMMDAFGTAISHVPAIRRAAGGPGQQVLAHAVRADGAHDEPRHPHRQERGRLHLPLDGHPVPAGYREANSGDQRRAHRPRRRRRRLSGVGPPP